MHAAKGFSGVARCVARLPRKRPKFRLVAFQRSLETTEALESAVAIISADTDVLLRRCLARHLLHRAQHCSNGHLNHLADVLSHGPRTLLHHVTQAVYEPPGWATPGGKHRCNLSGADACRRFLAPKIAGFVASLFEFIQQLTSAPGDSHDLPLVRLCGHDLFHAHLFLVPSDAQVAAAWGLPGSAPRGTFENAQHVGPLKSADWQAPSRQGTATAMASPSGGVGLLFHAKEYPQYCPTNFPFHLGHCQANSTVAYNQRAMDLRNMVYYQGKWLFLDVAAGRLLHWALLREETLEFRTVAEDDLGTPLVDVCYFPSTVSMSSSADSVALDTVTLSGLRAT